MTELEIFELLLQAMRHTRKNKRYGRDSVEFEQNWPAELVRFMEAFENREFRIDNNYAFLTSYPKWREIFATFFQGRIADHILCDTLMPYIEQELHPMTFNNRIGKGSQAAINQVIENIYEASEGYTKTAWVIKWDLKGFFPNAVCDIMQHMFEELVKKYRTQIVAAKGEWMYDTLLWLPRICIQSNPSEHCILRTPWPLWAEHIDPSKSLFYKEAGIGVPIGRMSSQMGMGLYINDEVRWLNEECGIKTVVFMDDGVSVVPDELKDYALSLLPELRRRLAAKGVRVNDQKFYCQQYWKGFEFLGSHIKPNRIILNDRTYARALERVQQMNALPDYEKYDHIDKFIATINSYTGLLKGRSSYQRITDMREAISSEWWEWLYWDDRRLCVNTKPRHSFCARAKRKYNLKHLHCNETRRKNRAHQCPADNHSRPQSQAVVY